MQLAQTLAAPAPKGPSPHWESTDDDHGSRLQLSQLSPSLPAAAGVSTAGASNLAAPLQIVVTIRVNMVAKGDFLVFLTSDGDFLLRPRELADLGILHPVGHSVQIGNEMHLSLRSMNGAEFRFDEMTLTLDLQIAPNLLPSQTVNLGSTLPATPVQRRAPGGFLNYRFGVARSDSAATTLNATTEMGVAIGELLLVDNHVFNTPSEQARSVRLQTQLIYDQPATMRRWIAGDSFVSSGELGGSINLGGIGVSKLYQINPYFIKAPLAGYAGSVAQPSTIDVYVDGVRVRTEQVAPGNFNLQNLSAYSATGLRNVDLVVRDPFGREQHIGFPYFFSDQLLVQGLSEYSYNAGMMRNSYGVHSADYGAFAASAFHRYGFTDKLTFGLGGDANREHINIGPRATFNTVSMGVVAAAVSVSRDRGDSARSGNAFSLNHTFLSGPFSSQILLRRYSVDYSVIGFNPAVKPKLQASASASYGTGSAGTYSFAYETQSVYGSATDRRVATLGFNKTLRGNLSLVINLSRVDQGTGSYLAFIGLAYYPVSGVSVSASHQRDSRGDSASGLQVNKTPPVGEGLGYRVFAERADTAGTASESVSPFVQYNTRTAIFTAESTAFRNGGGGNSRFFQLAAAGAVTTLGNRFYFSRPIDDSYAVVRIDPPLAGVRVMSSNDVAGKTDADGVVFVPHLGSYQVNDVSIQVKDLPLDVMAANTTLRIRPPYRSGALAIFPVTHIHAVTGHLKWRGAGGARAIESASVELAGAAGNVTLNTVRNGDFYLENLPAGRYVALLQVGEGSCRLAFTVPDSREIVTDLGDLFCESAP